MNMNVSKALDFGLFAQCHDRLNKIGKMTFENVSKTDEKTRQFLRDNSPVRLKELAQLNCFAADKIKREFDSRFGENNYVLIAIGRSVSSIIELVGKLGVDTKIIPMSGLRRREISDIKKDDLHTYKTFLVQKGLSKIDLKKNMNKTHILMDYTHYGRSLEKTKQLLNRKDMLGEAENLISIPIKEVLGEDYVSRKFDDIFMCSRFKDYSYVGKLHVDDLKNVYERCSPERVKEFQGNITKGLRKLFWFNTIDSYLNKNYKDVSPKTEMSALYKHYLSSEAIQRYMKRESDKQNKIIDSYIKSK